MPPYNLANHEQVVKSLALEVASFYKSHTPFRINHGSTNSTRVRNPSAPQLNIACLNHILSIDADTKTAIVEPNVPLDALLAKTLKYGLMPPVVMEFPGITVGGAFSGASGESTSWKEGLFDCSIDEVEIILGNGEIVRAVKGGEKAELFDAARCTLGTLGVVTLLKVQLTKAEDHVLVNYERKGSVKETIDGIVELCEKNDTDFDFIEALLYGKNEGVIITGRHLVSTYLEALNIPRQRFDRATDPWFYRHAKEVPTFHREIVPIESYLFRYDRGAFWGGETMLRYFGLPSNRFTRALFNPLTKTRSMYKAMLSTGSADFAIIQDLILPIETAELFVDYVADELKIWPLWVCPIRKKAEDSDVWGWPFWKGVIPGHSQVQEKNAQHTLRERGQLALNLGVWGAAESEPAHFRRTNRQLEGRLRDLHGMKVPYAAMFYTEEEFWGLYDRERYERWRKRWHAEALPTIYDKVRRLEQGKNKKMSLGEGILWIWPFGGLYQIYCIIFR